MFFARKKCLGRETSDTLQYHTLCLTKKIYYTFRQYLVYSRGIRIFLPVLGVVVDLLKTLDFGFCLYETLCWYGF